MNTKVVSADIYHELEVVIREATLQIRAKGSKVRLIVMTTKDMQGDREKYLAAGMDDYVSKSIQVRKITSSAGVLQRDPTRESPINFNAR